MKTINQPLASVVTRCIENSPDSEAKRREVAKLKAMFGDDRKGEVVGRGDKSVAELMDQLFG